MRVIYESPKLVIKIRSSLVIIKWEWGKPLAATPAEVTKGSNTRSPRACYTRPSSVSIIGYLSWG